jgi:hypothetical protein
LEGTGTFGVGGHATVAAEKRVLYAFRRVFGVVIAAIGIRLPEFDHSIRYSDAVAVENPAREVDPIAGRALGRNLAEGPFVGQTDVQIRADSLRWG